MPPPSNSLRVRARMLFLMMLLRLVGELKTKITPPPTTTGAVGAWPAPPVIVNPSRMVAGVCPLAKVTTEHWVPAFLAQKLLFVQGFPEELIVVTAAPLCEVTLTFGFIRMASG